MNEQTYQISQELANLEASLLKETPDMPVLLRKIHTHLKRDPELVTLLTDDEAAILVQGLKKQTSTEIVASAVKKAPKKALSKMTVDDL